MCEFLSIKFCLDTMGLVLTLFFLETILSADNAIALAALVQNLEDPKHQRQALNIGLGVAFALRISLLLSATWVMQFWQFEVAGALYLIGLVSKHFWERFFSPENEFIVDSSGESQWSSFWGIIPLIALTDVAFSLDSVTTAVAVSDRIGVVIVGCLFGVITLRFLANLFVNLLTKFVYLQDAAYLTVLFVGIRLLCKAFLPEIVPPDWTVIMGVIALLSWGFSKPIPSEQLCTQAIDINGSILKSKH